MNNDNKQSTIIPQKSIPFKNNHRRTDIYHIHKAKAIRFKGFLLPNQGGGEGAAPVLYKKKLIKQLVSLFIKLIQTCLFYASISQFFNLIIWHLIISDMGEWPEVQHDTLTLS